MNFDVIKDFGALFQTSQSTCDYRGFDLSVEIRSFINFHNQFSIGRVVLGDLEIPHDFQQSLIVLLAPHHDETKQGRRCGHSAWSLVDP